MQNTVVNALYTFLSLILIIIQWDWYYSYPYFSSEEIKWLFIVLVIVYLLLHNNLPPKFSSLKQWISYSFSRSRILEQLRQVVQVQSVPWVCSEDVAQDWSYLNAQLRLEVWLGNSVVNKRLTSLHGTLFTAQWLASSREGESREEEAEAAVFFMILTQIWHTIPCTVFYWSHAPTLVQYGRGLYKGIHSRR